MPILKFLTAVCLLFTPKITFLPHYAVNSYFSYLISGSKVASSCPRRKKSTGRESETSDGFYLPNNHEVTADKINNFIVFPFVGYLVQQLVQH